MIQTPLGDAGFQNEFEPLTIDTVAGRDLMRLYHYCQRHQLSTGRVMEACIPRPRRIDESTWRHLLAQLAGSDNRASAEFTLSQALTPREALILRFGQATGTTKEVLELMTQTPPREFMHRWRYEGSIRQVARSLIGMVIMSLILTFHTIFIFPTFEKIFDEFGMEVPMRWVFDLAAGTAAWILMGVLLTAIGIAIWSMTKLFRTGRSFDRSDFHSLLAVAIDAGRPAGSVLTALTNLLPSTQLRTAIESANASIASGSEPWNALAQHGLIDESLEQSLLVAPDVHARSWLLKYQGSTLQRKRSRVPLWAWRIAAGVTFIALAVVTMLISVAVMMSLSSLVSGLS